MDLVKGAHNWIMDFVYCTKTSPSLESQGSESSVVSQNHGVH